MIRIIFSICLVLSFWPEAFGQTTLQGESELAAAKTPDARIATYKKIFRYYEFSQQDSAIKYLKRGKAEFEAANNRIGIGWMMVLEAYMDADQGRRALAKDKHHIALEIFTNEHYVKGMATAHNGIGIQEVKSGNFPEATRHFLEALRMYESSDDRDGVVNVYQKLGAVNEASNNLEKALEYYFLAIKEIAKRPVKGTNQAWIFNNIGVVYGKMGQLDKAHNYLQMALDSCTTPAFTDLRLLTLNNLGILHDKMGEDAKALKYFDEAIAITADKELPENRARLSVSRASVVNKTDPAKGLQMLKEALVPVQQLGLKTLEADIYDCMVESYERLKQYEPGYQYLKKLRSLVDSLENLEKTQEMANMQSQYELEKTKSKVARIEAQQKTDKTIREFTLILVLVLASTLFFMAGSYRKTKKLNEELNVQKDNLRKSNDVKDRLFSVIGHDLRGPLGQIPPSLELLEGDIMTPEERKYLVSELSAQTRASIDTLDKLLVWGTKQIQGNEKNESRIYVKQQAAETLKLLTGTAKVKRILLNDKLPEQICVMADPSHFDFILRNLLSNAIKFTHPEGTIELNADTDTQPGYVVFSVKDTGIGMPQLQMEKLFEPFNKASRGTANEKGSGIGLMLCKEYTELNGGKIWATSKEGEGSSFYFSLKRCTEA